jgi:hypothetical protein
MATIYELRETFLQSLHEIQHPPVLPVYAIPLGGESDTNQALGQGAPRGPPRLGRTREYAMVVPRR